MNISVGKISRFDESYRAIKRPSTHSVADLSLITYIFGETLGESFPGIFGSFSDD